jgi:hypothetical protein
MTDLFGSPMADADFSPKPKPRLLAVLPHYRKAESKDRRCGTCARCQMWEGSRRWYKCDLVGGHSERTDVRVGHVCDAWEKQP